MKFPVIEMFGPTLQGEGPMIGVRTHFIRFGGCPYRCKWCDSLYAVLPEEVKKNATRMTAHEISERISKLDKSNWITLTGGDPVMYDLNSVVEVLGDHKLSVETEGALWHDWLKSVEQVVVSPKAPSSGMSEKTDWDILAKYEAIN
ncbi:MAG: 4Fe-4S cluster-binding domain-containing protein, partial [Rhodospirillaceae bacterium]